MYVGTVGLGVVVFEYSFGNPWRLILYFKLKDTLWNINGKHTLVPG